MNDRQKKRRRKRSRPGDKPPNRGHGSNSTRTLRSRQLSDKFRERLAQQGGAQNPVEGMAAQSLADQDAAEQKRREARDAANVARQNEQAEKRRVALEAAARRREQQERAGGAPAEPRVFSPVDRALINRLITALQENTKAQLAVAASRDPNPDAAAVDTALYGSEPEGATAPVPETESAPTAAAPPAPVASPTPVTEPVKVAAVSEPDSAPAQNAG